MADTALGGDTEDASSEPTETWGQAIAGSAILHTLLAMVAVSGIGWALGGDGANPFVLAAPLAVEPWTILTSVYAHASPGHLLGNALVILTAGTVVAYATTTLRFHAFVVLTGTIAGVSQIFLAGAFGWDVGVLGISGAGFALIGYLLAGNRVTNTLLGGRVSARTGAVLVALVAGGLTIFLSGTRAALAAHFVGAALGLLAGYYRVLAT
ncbi:MAG: rhomboid family intramembrane serine protease [Halobacteriales archaeon]